MAKFITTIWRRNIDNSNGNADNNLASNFASNIGRSIEELANVLQKNVRYLRNEIIPRMVQESKLFPTKQKNDPSQCYITHSKWKK